jgi:hypothetical protein
LPLSVRLRGRALACAGRRPSAGAQLIAPLLHGRARSDFNREDFQRSCSWAHAPATTNEKISTKDTKSHEDFFLRVPS